VRIRKNNASDFPHSLQIGTKSREEGHEESLQRVSLKSLIASRRVSFASRQSLQRVSWAAEESHRQQAKPGLSCPITMEKNHFFL